MTIKFPNTTKIIKDLIVLSGKSPSRIAEEAGLSRSGVLLWLKKEVGIGSRARDKLLSVLGVSGGTLASDRVHRWTINQNLDSLREILAWVGEEFENIVLIPQNIEVKDWFPTSTLFLLYSSPKSIRILLMQKISPLVPPGPSSWVIPANLPHVKWFDYQKGSGIVDKLTSNPLLRIPRNLFDKFMSDSPVSLEEYDQILELMKKIPPQENGPLGDSLTWEMIRQEMERRGLGPEDVLAMMDTPKGKISK